MPRSLTTHIDSPREVGIRLREARERAGLSQRQLAFPGCTAAYISRIEAGARVPSLQMINQLALRLDTSGQWLATGVEAAPEAPVDLVEAEVALRLGEVEEAERQYRAHLQPGDPARPAALAGLGQIALRNERFDDAIELLEEALDAQQRRALADPGAVEALGRAYASRGRLESAIALFEQAAKEAADAEATVERMRFTVVLANALIDAHELSRAESALADVIRLSDDLGDPVATARLFWSQSRLHAMRGDPELAARYARKALAILERTENETYVGMAYHLLAFNEIEAGNFVDALPLLEKGRALFGDDLRPLDEARFSIEEARALSGLDRQSDAARAAARAVERLDQVSPGTRGRMLTTLGAIFLDIGDRERARTLLEEGLQLHLQHGPRFALEPARKLADILEADGDTAGALDVLKRATGAGTGAPV